MLEEYSLFGFQRIKSNLKNKLVHDIFSDVSKKYDLMNDLMSLGIHRLWKRCMVQEIYPLANKIILDVAGGTGDISKLIRQTGIENTIFICDINLEMIQAGRDKFINQNIDRSNIYYVCGDAEHLPIKDCSIDFYLVSFGIRNFSNISQALREAHRVLKPGGKFICLEFSRMTKPHLRVVYEKYLRMAVPLIGKIVAKNQPAYQYLAESIQTFPDQQEFAEMIENAGFCKVDFHNLTYGIASIHSGFKLL